MDTPGVALAARQAQSVEELQHLNGDIAADSRRIAEGSGVADGVGDGLEDGVGLGDALGVGVGVGVGLADGLGVGSPASPSSIAPTS